MSRSTATTLQSDTIYELQMLFSASTKYTPSRKRGSSAKATLSLTINIYLDDI